MRVRWAGGWVRVDGLTSSCSRLGCVWDVRVGSGWAGCAAGVVGGEGRKGVPGVRRGVQHSTVAFPGDEPALPASSQPPAVSPGAPSAHMCAACARGAVPATLCCARCTHLVQHVVCHRINVLGVHVAGGHLQGERGMRGSELMQELTTSAERG